MLCRMDRHSASDGHDTPRHLCIVDAEATTEELLMALAPAAAPGAAYDEEHDVDQDPEESEEEDDPSFLADMMLAGRELETRVSEAPGQEEEVNAEAEGDGGDEPGALMTPMQRVAFLERMRKCGHPVHNFEGAEVMAASFARLSATERSLLVRGMLFATSSPAGALNEMGADVAQAQRKSKRRREESDGAARSWTVYCLQGVRLCRDSFAAVVGLSPLTVSSYAQEAVQGKEVVVPESKKALSRRGKYGIQRILVSAFLREYARCYALESPMGRHAIGGKTARILPSDKTKVMVYEEYKKAYKELAEAAKEFVGPKALRVLGSSEPVKVRDWRKMWAEDHPTLRIAKPGTDFCDTCTTLKKSISKTRPEDEVHKLCARELAAHLEKAKSEFLRYKELQRLSAAEDNESVWHYVFDFAEKVLLPRLLKQPGQLHFITGLKFDINCVSSSKTGTNYLFGLPEGHWPNDKTANSVLSMFYHCLVLREEGAVSAGKELYVTADNSAGQNKNRYVLWFLNWLVLTKRFTKVTLNFLVCGHTKNVCDGAFGHVKRRLRRTNARTPSDMMDVIESSSETSTLVASVNVAWRDWKEMLLPYFKVPCGLSISKYHQFEFSQASPTSMKVKEYSYCPTSQTFCLLKPTVALETFATVDWDEIMHKHENMVFDDPLEKVFSKQNGTRANYLRRNIVDRYYSQDPDFAKNFFASGVASKAVD